MSKQAPKSTFSISQLKAIGTGRIARRLVDFFAILICTVILLSIGFNLSEWWRMDETAVILAGIQSTSRPVQLVHPQIQVKRQDSSQKVSRDSFSGNTIAVLKELTKRCQNHLVSSNRTPVNSKITLREQRLLAELALLKPLSKEENVWEIYSIPGRWPSIIGILNTHAQTELSSISWRVMFWSMAIPLNQQQWRIWMLENQPEEGKERDRNKEPSLPPGAEKILSLDSGKQGQLMFFSGMGPVKNWTRFFDRYYQNLKWDKTSHWKQVNDRFSARFSTRTGSVSFTVVDIIIYRSDKNSFKGIRIRANSQQ